MLPVPVNSRLKSTLQETVMEIKSPMLERTIAAASRSKQGPPGWESVVFNIHWAMIAPLLFKGIG